jgi:hypothetical protein
VNTYVFDSAAGRWVCLDILSTGDLFGRLRAAAETEDVRTCRNVRSILVSRGIDMP